MTTRYYLTTTPNQANFIGNGIAPYHSGKIIHLDETNGQYDYPQLLSQMPEENIEVWFPYQDCPLAEFCVTRLRCLRAGIKITGYYESLMSYFARPWFESLYSKPLNATDTLDIKQLDSFVGIADIDHAFLREHSPFAPSFAQVYPKSDLSRPELERAGGIFIGQPLATYGTMKPEVYSSIVRHLVEAGLVDTYIMHPREKEAPCDNLTAIRLGAPIENFRDVLATKKLYSVFSTSSAYYSINHHNVTIIAADSSLFAMSAWAHEVYAWLQQNNPVIHVPVKTALEVPN